MNYCELILGKWDFIFLLGESGGGKGTLVSNIKKYWLKDLNSSSMGDMFRERSKTDPTIQSLTEQGLLIGDSIAFQVFEEFANNNMCGLIDGFPRNREQALMATKFIKERGWRVLVIDLKCDLEIIIERLLARGRADDKLDIMYKRNLAHRTLHPAVMKEIVKRKDLYDVITLDGNQSAETVCNKLLLEVLRLVDLLHLYEIGNLNVDFFVKKEETSVDNALNYWLSNILVQIQEKISQEKKIKSE